MIKVALDAMGGDNGPSVVVKAAVEAINQFDDLELILVGNEPVIRSYLQQSAYDQKRIHVHHTDVVVTMDDSPAIALRTKKTSSMRLAINLIKEGKADAVVSAGNTGALMATAKFVLKTIPGVIRPAIIYGLPSPKGPVYVLDLGANVDCDAENLFQFGVMGSILAEAMNGEKPRVALLNVGHESIKGSEVVKAAADKLSQCKNIHYIGYVEGNHIFKRVADVIVCDGFVGNVALKVTEGLASMLGQMLKEEFTRTWCSKMLAFAAMPVLKKLKMRMDARQYNGASLLGLQGSVIKSHGNADHEAYLSAIKVARKEAMNKIPEKISEQIKLYLHAE